MKILVVGGGGREHALVWKLSKDRCKPVIYCAPGNAGTATLAENLPLSADDLDGICAWALENQPDRVVIGPEIPLCMGLTDRLQSAGLRVFGPVEAAARLESSKVFSKEVMMAAGVPVAQSCMFTSAAEAKDYVRAQGLPIVIKAEGLAAGKGVTVCETLEQAETAIDQSLTEAVFGEAGSRILVEECLVGEEASILAMVDGERAVMLASAQDHKRAHEDDQGPNTGGMGAYSPAPVVSDDRLPMIQELVFDRTLAELKRRGITFKGILYAGLMFTDAGVRVLEFNVRFGDPEAQVILSRLDGDLLPLIDACIDGTLDASMVRWKEDPCVTVVMAAGGYPGAYRKGVPIEGLDKAAELPGVNVFHAGTAHDGASVVTAGGRVLNVTAIGTSLEEAVDRAYQAAEMIQFEGGWYRRDIAAKAL